MIDYFIRYWQSKEFVEIFRINYLPQDIEIEYRTNSSPNVTKTSHFKMLDIASTREYRCFEITKFEANMILCLFHRRKKTEALEYVEKLFNKK